MAEEIDILYIHPFGKQIYESPNYYLFDKNLELKDHNAEKYYSFIPMGLIGTLNKVRDEGYNVKGINLPLRSAISGLDISLYLKDIDVKVVLIDMHWYVHLKDGLKVAKLCKSMVPNAKIVVGGMTASIFPKQLMGTGLIDFVILGDSELPFYLLIENIIKGKENKVPNLVSKEFVNKIKYCSSDINEHNYVDIDFMEDYWSYLHMFDFWLLVAKGCNYDCSVCDGGRSIYPSIYSRNRLIVRDVINVAKDIKRLEGKAQTVALSHDLDMLGKRFWSELLQHKYGIGIRNEFFQLPSIKLIGKLAASFEFLDLVFSPVSGDDSERRKYGKNFLNEDFLKLLKQIKDIDFNGGITVYFSDYMVSQLKIERLDSLSRELLIKSIKDIHPYAVIEVQHQVIDPMVMIKNGLEPDKAFKSLI